MVGLRPWRVARAADGPFPARVEEIGALNVVFSDAFTERYRRDGMVGVRVPNLNPQVWRYAIEDSAEGDDAPPSLADAAFEGSEAAD